MKKLFRSQWIFKNFAKRLNQSNLQILGLSSQKTYSLDEIKKSYVKLAKIHHPDVSKLINSQEKFQKIVCAYSELMLEINNGTKNSNDQTNSGFSQKRKNEWTGFHQSYDPKKEWASENKRENAKWENHSNFYQNYYEETQQNQKRRFGQFEIVEFIQFFLVFSLFFLIFWTPVLNPNDRRRKSQNHDKKKYLIMKRRAEMLGHLPKISISDCRRLSIVQLVDLERRQIARIPDEVFEELMEHHYLQS